MKLRISRKELDNIIREEAIKLKTARILKEGVSGKISQLEKNLANVLKEMRDVYASDEIDEEVAGVLGLDEDGQVNEIWGFGKISKAEQAYKAAKAEDLAKLKAAYKSYSPEYIQISTELLNSLRQDVLDLMAQHGIDKGDFRALYGSLKQVVQPMDFATFKRQAGKGGFSMRDVASGSKAGAKDFGME